MLFLGFLKFRFDSKVVHFAVNCIDLKNHTNYNNSLILIILIIICYVLILFFLKNLRRGINLDSTKTKKTKCVTSCAYCPTWEA